MPSLPHCKQPAQADHTQLYELLVGELTDFAVFLTDPDGCAVSWNPGVERILGYGKEEWLGQLVERIFTPEDRAQGVPQQEMASAAQEGRSPDIRWHLHKDGERLYVEGTMVALRDKRGQLLGFSKIMRDITERKKQEERSRQQRHTFDSVLSRIPDQAYTFDRAGRFTYANQPLLALLQQSPEEIIGKSFFDLPCPPVLAGRFERQIQQVFDTQHSLRDDTPFVDPMTGETRHYEYILAPVLSKDGSVEAVSGSSRDITERERMKRAESASEQRFGALVSASSDVLYRMSPDWTEMRQLGGGGFVPDTDSANPDWLQDYIHPDDQPAVWDEIQTAVRTKGIFELEHRVRRVDGTLGWTHSRAIPILDADGEVLEWFGAASDITERRSASAERDRLLQQIETERQRLQQAFAQAPVSVIVFRGQDFLVELVNPSFQALLVGRDLVGHRFADVMPELEADVWEVLQRVLETGEPFLATDWHVPYDYDQDGAPEDRWFNFAFNPLREADGTVSGLIAVLTEVTVQVRARQDLERTNQELARVNGSLEEFAYVASHDLQEPLRMVNIYTQLLLQSSNGEREKREQYARFVQDGVQRMESLIHDLLTFSRTIHNGQEPVATAALSVSLSEALTVLKARMEESGAIVTASPLPIVRGDGQQWAHVFQNLLENSIKYRAPDRVPEIHITAEREQHQWIVAVRDNGIGFEPQYAKQIFGLFKRLHRNEYPGTGLGLAICQRIVERSGGRIWAESQPGVGCAFFVSVPSLDEEPL